ncbi:alpha/beta hydrolase family protein [Streptosporangium algeriense]|uniref:Alpha/beta hydrolase family protein n=1 Tax=Streptosporangium algeriense TaxID=1682748 RepID=A0ABW3DPD8_9ACTN
MPTFALRGALAVAVTVSLLTSAAPATATTEAAEATRVAQAVLPRPTGPYPVGTTTLHLVDDSRPDPWVPSEKSRQILVSLWYPARSNQGPTAPYMTPQESALLLEGQGIEGLPPDILSRTRTNAVAEAPPAGRGRSLPLVMLSPGLTAPRSSLTALAEDLASRGYVVAGVDHTYESFGTTFPDGHTTTCVACQSWDSPEYGAKSTKVRAADVSFVLDRLTGPRPAWRHARLINPSRIAMAGHSIGGGSATWAMLGDSRIDAGVNMDGAFHIPIPERGLSRPFMFLGEPKTHVPTGTDATWGRDWPRLTGWKRWFTVGRADHTSFTDYPLITDQLGLDPGDRLPGTRLVEITRRYVGAFLDLTLRHRSQPFPRYPEVTSWRP